MTRCGDVRQTKAGQKADRNFASLAEAADMLDPIYVDAMTGCGTVVVILAVTKGFDG